VVGTYGTLVLNAMTGAYVYTLDNASPTTDALEASDSKTESFSVQVSDGVNITSAQSLSFTINGAYDPTVARVIDGYIMNGFVFRDENGNGTYDSGEASAHSGSDGLVTIGGTKSQPMILDPSQDPEARTTVDIDKPNQAFNGVLMATGGSSVITPLTTLVTHLVQTGEAVSAAQTAIKSGLGIASNVDLSTVDPIASGNVEVYKVGAQVGGLIGAAGGGASGLEITKALANAVKTAVSSNQTVSLSDIDFVKAVVETAKVANPTVMAGVDADSVAYILASQSTALASATSAIDVVAVLNASFVITESADVVSFSGTATGDVTMSLNSAGGATFSRAGVNGRDGDSSTASVVTIDSVSTKVISGLTDLNIVLTAFATSGDDEIVINAPSASVINFIGDTGAGSDSIKIKIDDVVSGSADVRTVTVNTSDLSVSSSDKIVFAFEGAEDIVILDGASSLSQFDTVEVSKGTADVRSVTLKDGVDLIVNSGVILSLEQFLDADSVTSVSGHGELEIILESHETLQDLNDQFDPNFINTGADIKVKTNEGHYLLDAAEFQEILTDAAFVALV